MDEPDFDYDALIDDYIEDSFEPPPPPDHGYDEDFLEEMATQQNTAEKTTNNNNPAAAASAPPATEETKQDDDEPPSDRMDTDDTNDARPPLVRDIFAPRRPEEDLFTFERYNGSSTWRSETTAKSASSPVGGNRTMRATSWKAKEEDDDTESTTESPLHQSRAWQQAKAQLSSSYRAPTTTTTSTSTDSSRLLLSSQQRNLPAKMQLREDMPLRSRLGATYHSFTLGDGTRLYARVRSEQELEQKSSSSSSRDKHYALGVSMSELLKRVRATQRKQEHENQRRLRREQARAMNDSSDEDEVTSEEPSAPADTRLWVDKHAPSSFAHLLSDERTNREVVRALRAWDPYVFHKEAPKRPEFYSNNGQFPYKGNANNKSDQVKGSGKKPGVADMNRKPKFKQNSNPKDSRPEENARVILLSGPPGVGKTTLAHIAARHAGYRPLEVNGSDERSESVLTDRVVRAMESSTLNVALLRGGDRESSKPVPNCLILDEIDGADAKGAIQALVEIIRADIPTKNTKNKKPFLRRPIICICNNKFAPALRPLLPFCRQFNVSPPSPNRLVSRLFSVLNEENMALSGGSSLLHQLVSVTCGDIRSCLYTLQFVSTRAKELALSTEEGESSNSDGAPVDISSPLKTTLQGDGMKDERNDIAGTVTAIFRKEKTKRFNESRAARDRRSSTKRVLDVVQSFGDNSRILDCLFLNILRVSYIDPTFDRCSAAHEWLSSSDLYRSFNTMAASNNTSEKFAMEAMHIPATAVALHLMCRVEQRPDLTYTTRDLTDAVYRQEANVSLAQKFIEGLSPQVRGSRCVKATATETIPYALWVLSAGEGSGSLDKAASSMGLLSERVLKSVEAHVAAMSGLGLSYVGVQEQGYRRDKDSSNATVSVRLEPPIERLTNFVDLSRSQERREIPPTMKELLAQRVAHDGMTRRGQATVGSDCNPTQAPKAVERKPKLSSLATVMPPSKRTSTGDDAPEPKRAKASLTSKNFLGVGARMAKEARKARTAARVGVQNSKKNKRSHTGSGRPFDEVVRFKYVKGFTQAVRKPCRMEDIS